ncbi:unnamed protein product [Cuscuta campestris]|uniref:DUF4408 domain-containing protein n=1 Tax=Cuscuta campestris TaxID=132261 RepID=A0A484M838_9ASTE|nr:unnamed protein product [Cuscuta campestris]
MLEESNAASMNMNSSSIWSSMASWFTPTVLFLLLNLMIGTIALSSTLSCNKQKHPKKNQEPHHHLDKSPSVLHRLRSINFSSFRFHETSIFKSSPDSDAHPHPQTFEDSQFHNTHQETPVLESPATHYIFRQEYHQEESLTHYTFQQEEEEEEVERESMDEVYSRLNRRPESQSQPEVKTSAEEESPERMKKSASVKSRVNPFEGGGNLERRRPATVKERGKAADLEVDARADDFINRFKQQLKMQRLDSILRYKEMIGRGAGK